MQLPDRSYIVARYLPPQSGTERIIDMTESLESVEINVLGRAYRVSCQPDQYLLLRQAAQKLNDAIGDLRIRARGSSNEQLAIMVALNLSHELLLEKNRIQQYSESMEQRIRQLNDVIQEALKEQSKLLNLPVLHRLRLFLTTRLMLRVRKSLAYFLAVTLMLALFTELSSLVLLRVRESLNLRLHFLIFREVWNIFHTFLPRQTRIS